MEPTLDVARAPALSGRVLWTAAVVITLAAAVWQRRTGPSYPYHTTVVLGGQPSRLALPRSQVTTSGAPVTVAAPAAVQGTLYWRRYPTPDAFAPLPLREAGGTLGAVLPAEPAAGKVQYYLELGPPGAAVRVPRAGAVVLRYRGPVPAAILLPHILLMFLGLLFGTRAGLGALVNERGHHKLALHTLAAYTLGGLCLGPIVQKFAFGAYWTGVPFGWDLTDNKTLLMWIGWAIAALVLAFHRQAARRLVLLAAVVTLVVYVVPHSAQGSELDYSTLPAQPRD